MNRILKQRARQLYGSRALRLLLVYLLHFLYLAATALLPYLLQDRLMILGFTPWWSFFLSAMVQLALMLLLLPLLLGVCRYSYLLHKERDPGAGDALRFFTSPGRYLKGVGAGVIWYLPNLLTLVVTSLMDSGMGDGVEAVLMLALVLLQVFNIYWSLHICLLPYILAEDEAARLDHARRESFRLMRGSCGRYFGLCLSFIGWYLLIGAVITAVMMYFLIPEIIRMTDLGITTVPEALVDRYALWINLAAFLLSTLLMPYIGLAQAGFADAALQGRLEELAWQGQMPYGWGPNTTGWQQPPYPPRYPQQGGWQQGPTTTGWQQQGPTTTSWQQGPTTTGWQQPQQGPWQSVQSQGVYSAAQQEEAAQYEAYRQGRPMAPKSFSSWGTADASGSFHPWLQVEQSGLYSFLKLESWMPGMVTAAWQQAAAGHAAQPAGSGAAVKRVIEESLGGSRFRVTAIVSDDPGRPGFLQVRIDIDIQPVQ